MQPQGLVGLVVIEPRNPDDRAWRDFVGVTAAGGVAWAVASASDESSFRASMDAVLADMGARIVEIEEIESLASRQRAGSLGPALTELVDRFDTSGEPQLGDLRLFPHVEQDYPPDWLDSVAQDEELSDLQRAVVGHIADMLRALELPLLDGVSLVRSDEGIHVELMGAADQDLALSILIGDDNVGVDYGWSHVHFEVADEPEELDEALQFIFSALQGGVKVEVWMADGEVERARTLVLYEAISGSPSALGQAPRSRTSTTRLRAPTSCRSRGGTRRTIDRRPISARRHRPGEGPTPSEGPN